MAAAIGDQIDAGTLVAGQPAPPARDLAAANQVSLATAKRSLVLAVEWGLLERIAPGSHVVAADPEVAPAAEPAPAEPAGSAEAAADDGVLLDLAIRWRGTEVARFSAIGDPYSALELQEHLGDAILRNGGDSSAAREYEMDVRRAGETDLIMTFVARRRSR